MKKIQINYKSGTTMTVRADKFTVSKNAFGNIVKITWENMKPDPLALEIENVESIWVL